MDSLPPNDPNNNNNNNNNNHRNVKEAPHDGTNRRRQNGGSQGENDNGEMDVLGNMQDQPVVVAMFLIGIASWFLRERCIC
mmetsp:Transcript_23483/g.30652  ORF Transcript_23483/g.30652 Transcript_23483/m.30652 type:complete len:81 (-) Transcript_23483:247-489(-)